MNNAYLNLLQKCLLKFIANKWYFGIKQAQNQGLIHYIKQHPKTNKDNAWQRETIRLYNVINVAIW